MKAILLAAGRGTRLKPRTETHHKCLTEIGGRSLLWRHLDILSTTDGIDGIHLILGYLEAQVREAVAEWQAESGHAIPIGFTFNALYRKGSILSFRAASPVLMQDAAIVMDADVIYPPELMNRLVGSTSRNCYLLDASSSESGEEMMVCVREGRVSHVARSADPSTQGHWDTKGEAVGFIRVGQQDAGALVRHLDEVVQEGQDEVDYEVAISRWVQEVHCGWESVHDLPWTEVDFPHDVARAEREILPRIHAMNITSD
jgi:choline kinase